MTTIADAVLAFHEALQSIDAERRDPTAIEDRILRHARNCVSSHPELAIQMLKLVPDAFRLTRRERSTVAVRTILEWRADLRTLAN